LGGFFIFERIGLVNEPTGFNKFVRNEFEHLRFVQMAQRVEGRDARNSPTSSAKQEKAPNREPLSL